MRMPRMRLSASGSLGVNAGTSALLLVVLIRIELLPTIDYVGADRLIGRRVGCALGCTARVAAPLGPGMQHLGSVLVVHQVSQRTDARVVPVSQDAFQVVDARVFRRR